MKIDLHCHTKAIKQGDSRNRNVTKELFKTKIDNADIKIVAITNHNSFDLEQYNELKSAVAGTCQVWPGVEIDVQEPSSQKWHLIVVVNPKEADLFCNSVNGLFKGDNIQECTHELSEICNAFSTLDAIYIAHFHEKRPAVPEKDGILLDKLVGEPYRVFKETANESSMSVFANYRYNTLVGSDVQDWNQYENCSFSELKLPVDSFEQFCMLAKRDENVVKTLLNRKESKRLIAHPAPTVDLPIQIYADINIIFGQKGTGKTEIINSLYESMKASGYKCVRYIASEREGDFNSLLRTNGLTPNLDKMGAKDCKDEFKAIFSWVDANPVSFTSYLNWKKTEGNNSNKTRMKITTASLLTRDDDKDNMHKTDKKTIDNICKTIRDINFPEYLNEEDTNILESLFEKLKTSIYKHRCDDLIDEQSVKLVNYSINTIKSIADKSTNSVSKPSTTGLVSFVETRLDLLRAVKIILNNLAVDEINEQEKIGRLDEKGDILINTKYRMLCSDSKADEFKNKGIRKLITMKKCLEELANHAFDSDISQYLRELTDLCDELGVNSATSFIGCSRQVVNKDGDIYSPSNGEKGILLLQRAILEEADAYFLDEPELGMGNSYIDSSIRPLLIDLAKRHKYVTVATHNANIGVRTLPYTSIYRTHSNGVYTTYVGNPFSDKLINIDDEQDVLNWAEESIKTLEGSKDGFYERKDIYESNNA